jgi:hypothetical protein
MKLACSLDRLLTRHGLSLTLTVLHNEANYVNNSFPQHDERRQDLEDGQHISFKEAIRDFRDF